MADKKFEYTEYVTHCEECGKITRIEKCVTQLVCDQMAEEIRSLRTTLMEIREALDMNGIELERVLRT